MPSRASRWARPVGLPSGNVVLQEDLADQLAAAPDAGLGEDRLETVLDGVRRQGKGVRHLHWSAEQNQGLHQRVRRAAQPGSALLLADFWTNPAHTEPLQAALMAGEFAVHLRTGDVYSVDEARGWLDRAGWRLVDHHRRRAGGRGVVRAPAGGHQQGAGATDAHRLRCDHARPARPANLERAADPLCGYRRSDGTVLGDPRYVDFTNTVRELGWPGGPGSSFDVLPLIVQAAGEPPRLFDVPTDAVLEVPFSHPRYE
jgi:Nitric oxide synthase, oxygenase domain